MKTLGLLALILATSVSAGEVVISDYNFAVPDIRKKNLNKEDLFKKMTRTLVRTWDSICSNRAHVWAYDFEKIGLNPAKIFMFFTAKTGHFDGVSWWYHVSPLINEDGKLYVMDAGFPQGVHKIDRPLLVQEWMKEFNGPKSVCKEITNADTDLLALIEKETAFPETTAHGTYNCYYKLVPAGYWTPEQVLKNNHDSFDEDEVFKACKETSTNPLGWMFRKTEEKCQDFVKNGSQNLTSL